MAESESTLQPLNRLVKNSPYDSHHGTPTTQTFGAPTPQTAADDLAHIILHSANAPTQDIVPKYGVNSISATAMNPPTAERSHIIPASPLRSAKTQFLTDSQKFSTLVKNLSYDASAEGRFVPVRLKRSSSAFPGCGVVVLPRFSDEVPA
jgi:hypothetical protein